MSRDQEYWKDRMTQLEKSQHRKAEEVVSELESAYRAAERQIESDISRWYQRFANNNQIVNMADARHLLTSGELKEFKWTVQDYIKHGRENGISADWSKELENASARFHISRLEAIKYQLQNTVEMLAGGQLDAMDSLLKQTYLNGYGQTAFTIQSGIGIGWDIAGINDRALKTVLYKPWTLDGKNFSDRIWENKQALINELQKQLTQHMMQGVGLNSVIDSIEKKFGVSRSNAARLVYTENAYALSVATGESYRATGVKNCVFIAVLDERTSEICQSMDGTVIDIKDYQPGVTIPPLHPWCRSTTAPYYADMDGIGERAARDEDGKTYYVPRNMTYPEWKETFMKDPETGEAGSKEGLTPVGAGVVRFYDSTLAKAFGKENYDACMDILEGCGNPDAQALWNAYQEDIGINTVKYRGHECCDWTASLQINLKNDMQGSFYEKPGQVVFHESGHAIDMIASRRFGFDTGTGKFYSPSDIFSLRYKDGLFPKTIKAEVEAMITAKGETIKEEFKAHSTDYQWLIQHGYLEKWKYDFYLKNGQWLGGEPSYTKELVYQAIKNEIRPLNYYQKANLNDILEGATGGKIGQGHGKAYFKKNTWALPTEAFAEMYDATVSSPESLEVIKQYLPKSYGVFCDMMKELVEGVK